MIIPEGIPEPEDQIKLTRQEEKNILAKHTITAQRIMASINNSDIYQVAVRRRIHLLVIGISAILLAFIFSGEKFIKPKFKSTAVVYPVNIIPYSMESPTEQLLQLFHSADVRAMMAKRFNLGRHYRINSASPAAQTRLNNTYDDNILVRKTEYESIKIDIEDENPDTASAMVNGLVKCVDEKARLLQREKTKEVVKIFSDQLAAKQKQIDSLENINNLLRVRYGLLDYKTQSKEATKSYLGLVSSGASKDRIREVDSLLRNLEEKGGAEIAVSTQLKSLRNAYNDIKIEYDKAMSDMTKELTYSNVITRPFPADSKCYPIRSLIVLVSGVSALMLGLLLFVIVDRRSIKPNAGTDQNG